MSSYAENMLTITACPDCAKADGLAFDKFHTGSCAVCGWMGNSDTVQSYSFPCWTYRVVEMDLSVVENLLSMARQLPEREEIKLSFNIKTGDIVNFAIEANFEEPTVKWGLRDALCYLVTTGWLFPAIYKIEIDV
jgi:hypothetical protein